jgi:hypothetical protein
LLILCSRARLVDERSTKDAEEKDTVA